MINANSNSGKVNISFVSPSGNGGSVVKSVNNKTGNVFLTAEDVGALPDTTEIPSIEGLASEDYVDRAVENIDLTNYYTRSETNNKFALKTEIPETSHLASKTYVDTKVKNVEVDLTGYATEDYVDAAIADLDVPEGVATEEYVQKKIAEAQLGEGEVDLSAYYTKSETDAAIEAAAPDLSGYALKTEIPSTTGLATESYVDEKFNSIEIPEVDLTDYYTKTEVDKKIDEAAVGGTVDLSNYYTKSEVDTAIENVEVDLTGYATEKYVGEQIAAIPAPDLSAYAKKEEIPSTVGLATEKYVDDAVAAIEIPEAADLSGYYTKEEVDKAIEDASFNPDEIELIEEVYVGTIEPGSDNDALIWINPEGEASTQYATQAYVDAAIAAIVDGDEVSY